MGSTATTEKSLKHEITERQERKEKLEKNERQDKPAEKQEKLERADRVDRTDRADRTERTERLERMDRREKSAKDVHDTGFDASREEGCTDTRASKCDESGGTSELSREIDEAPRKSGGALGPLIDSDMFDFEYSGPEEELILRIKDISQSNHF